MASAEALGREKLAVQEAATPLGRYPFTTNPDGSWRLVSYLSWVDGFLAGDDWLAYRSTGDPAWPARAARRQSTLAPFASVTSNHDIGFVLMSSYGEGYGATGDPSYRSLLLKGASSLSARYDPRVGMVRTSNAADAFYVYNDTMMNLQLLFFGARNGGSPAWRRMALSHAVRSATDFLRPDGGSYHWVSYDPRTGAVLRKGQNQGYTDSSTWSRGQAWMIYGEAIAYRETCDPRCLDAARKASDYWESRMPADLVPYWDFDAPGIPNEPRDSSAAAVAASAFVKLSRLDSDPARRARFAALGESTLLSLVSPAYLASPDPAATTALLMHGTDAKMYGTSDTGTSWGDYYLREALAEYRTQVLRASGPDRYATAVRASQLAFEHADTVVVTSGETFADAVSAGSLAGTLRAPILLVRSGSLPSGVASEIVRLGAGRVVIVGGTTRVSPTAEAALVAVVGRGGVSRIAGRDRYETSALVATHVLAGRGGTPAFLVCGDIFPDALSVSAVSSALGAPVLLVPPAGLPASTRQALESGHVGSLTVVGGASAVSSETAEAAASVAGVPADRVAGADRYRTSAAFASWALSRKLVSSSFIGLATGADYPDGLVGGVVAGSRRGPLLLTPVPSLAPSAADVLRSASDTGTTVWVFGGTPSVSEHVESQVRFCIPEG